MIELYVLNDQFKIDKLENIKFKQEYEELITDISENEKFVLVNEKRKIVLLINTTIYWFLSHFIKPNSIENVCNEFLTTVEKDNLFQVEKMTTSFFQEMIKKRIIVKEKEQLMKLSREERSCNLDINNYFKEYSNIELLVKKTTTNIYKATNRKNKITVILKVILLSANEKKNDNGLYNEYRILNKLINIDGVVNPINFFKNKFFSCLIMDYIDGTNLSDYIKTSINETMLTKIKIIDSLLKIMSKIHETNIIHGDIHARNFIIDKDIIKVIDFGLSREIKDKNLVKVFGGVVFYMSPERISNSIFHKYTFPPTMQSEVYQLGILIYMVLYNRKPFDNITWKKLADDILKNYPKFDSQILNGELIDNNIIALIRKSIDKDPNKRFSSAKEMYDHWKTINL